MKLIVVLGLIAVLFTAGCISNEAASNLKPVPIVPDKPKCSLVDKEVNVTTTECEIASVLKPVCGPRKLNYTATELPKTDLCLNDGKCVSGPVIACTSCLNAVSKCVMVIKNEDTYDSGVWSVSANFTQGKFGFIKNPISATIEPGKTYAFEFNQFYSPGSPIVPADCTISIVSSPVSNLCHNEVVNENVCANKTKPTTVKVEICN